MDIIIPKVSKISEDSISNMKKEADDLLIRLPIEESKEKVSKILLSEEFEKRVAFPHHWDRSLWEHLVKVGNKWVKYGNILHLSNFAIENTAIAWISHDMYDEPWQDQIWKKPFFEQHWLVHAGIAADNMWEYFPELMNERIDDAIRKHMFPLSLPPKYLESWLVWMADKSVSMEVVTDPKSIKDMLGFFKHGLKEKK